ncbi:MAG: Rpn family recombination-promoting nuclease/putative transposase [Firmicutes bacterium]|nr:Rpn family recombination-promoting nuclease/putative transposase [Bacillota bacterium]
MKKKSIEDLTIADDFMFGAVMSDPKLCKPLLEYILDIKIKRIEYPELQKIIDKRYESKGIRLDVYVEDDKNTVYNIEIQTTSNKNLPKRMRYYQGLIDLHTIDKGEDYIKLKKSFVIFICTYDPFCEGRYIYTFRNRCDENTDITLNDDTVKLVVNSTGTKGEINDELKATLDYIAGRSPTTPYSKNLDKAVCEIKNDEKWRERFMKLDLYAREHERLGEYANAISAIKDLRGNVEKNILLTIAQGNEKTLNRIIYFIDNNPEYDNYEIAERLLDEEE